MAYLTPEDKEELLKFKDDYRAWILSVMSRHKWMFWWQDIKSSVYVATKGAGIPNPHTRIEIGLKELEKDGAILKRPNAQIYDATSLGIKLYTLNEYPHPDVKRIDLRDDQQGIAGIKNKDTDKEEPENSNASTESVDKRFEAKQNKDIDDTKDIATRLQRQANVIQVIVAVFALISLIFMWRQTALMNEANEIQKETIRYNEQLKDQELTPLDTTSKGSGGHSLKPDALNNDTSLLND